MNIVENLIYNVLFSSLAVSGFHTKMLVRQKRLKDNSKFFHLNKVKIKHWSNKILMFPVFTLNFM